MINVEGHTMNRSIGYHLALLCQSKNEKKAPSMSNLHANQHEGVESYAWT